MLIILPVFPVAAPLKSVLGEETIAQVLMIDLVREVRIPVEIGFPCDRLNDALAVPARTSCEKASRTTIVMFQVCHKTTGRARTPATFLKGIQDAFIIVLKSICISIRIIYASAFFCIYDIMNV